MATAFSHHRGLHILWMSTCQTITVRQDLRTIALLKILDITITIGLSHGCVVSEFAATSTEHLALNEFWPHRHIMRLPDLRVYEVLEILGFLVLGNPVALGRRGNCQGNNS